MTTKTFENTLKNREKELEAKLEKTSPKQEENEVNINLLLSRKAIEVSFKFDPGYTTAKALTDFGFQWWIGHPVYEHADTRAARAFLNKLLNVELEIDEAPVQQETLDIEVRGDPEPVDPAFEYYTKQVDALRQHLKLDAADLQLAAIDALYKITFAN